MYLCILSLYVIRRGRLPGHDGRCRVGYVQWTTSPPVLRVEQSTLTSYPVRNVRLKGHTEKYVDGTIATSIFTHPYPNNSFEGLLLNSTSLSPTYYPFDHALNRPAVCVIFDFDAYSVFFIHRYYPSEILTTRSHRDSNSGSEDSRLLGNFSKLFHNP
ncbi:hypothetical protein TNCV_4437911 [Trichonephila clavipes]|nr:hypothetical protein TNCV_4437911 [Trichonephila clavipes]